MKTRQQIIQEQILKILSEEEKVRVVGVETTTDVTPIPRNPRTEGEYIRREKFLDRIEPLRQRNGLDRWGKPLRNPSRSAQVR